MGDLTTGDPADGDVLNQTVPVTRARAHARQHQRLRFFVAGACIVLAAAVIVIIAAGFRVFVVDSPSMGTTAPVGSLIVGKSWKDSQPLHVGDVITFHPPTPHSPPYTHRITAVTGNGFHTRGDINGADDPWLIPQAAVISRTVAILPGVGWIHRTAPILAAGITVIWVGTAFIRPANWRAATRLIGLSATITLVLVVLHPLTNYTLLTATSKNDHMYTTFVSTGMLPIAIHARGGGSTNLVSGQVGHLTLPPDALGRVHLSASLHLTLPEWCVLLFFCTLPTLWSLFASATIPQRRGKH